MNYTLSQLKRLRRLVLAVVLMGIGASIAMNVMHAPPTLPAQLVSSLPPLAVFASLELIARIPSSNRKLTVARIMGAVTVAGAAATISYAQQRAGVQELGFAQWEAAIWPLLVDGLMVVASVSLVEVVRMIRNMPAAQIKEAPSAPSLAHVPESAEVLAYRAAQQGARRLRQESAIAALNGTKQAG